MAKKMTLEKLAQMVQRGFSESASKKEIQQFREEVGERFDIVDRQSDSLANILRLMQDDNKRFKDETQAEIYDLWEHLRRLERKVGLRK
jgi:hypothetical protein